MSGLYDRFSADLEDLRLEAQDAAWEAARQDATCEDCEYCHIAPEKNMHWLTTYVVNTVRALYDKKDSVLRTDESLEYDFARACENARKACAWCSNENIQDFVNAETPARECDEFLPC